MSTSDEGETTLTLAVRTLSPRGCAGRQAETIRRLNALADRGVVDDVEVTVWGDRVATTTADAETDHGREVLETIGQFRAWADERGASLDPFFETRTVRSEFTGDAYETIELPSMVLAEYRDGDLYGVRPHAEDGETYTVGDRLAAIESASLDRAGEAGSPVAPPVAEE